MAEEPEATAHEAVRDPSDEEWLISIFRVDGQQHDPEARAKHWIRKAPATFREYEKEKKYFDPRVVSLGPYHHGEDKPMEMETHKIMAVNQFVDESRGKILYEKVKELTGELKEFYDAEVVGKMSDDVFARMMFLDGCFVLHFIETIHEGGIIMPEISNDLIPLIIRDMFLIKNQLPFQVLDALMMNLQGGTSRMRKLKILHFIDYKVLRSMGFYSLYSNRLLKWLAEDVVEQYDRPLHLLDILRTILLEFPTKEEMRSCNIPLNSDSVILEINGNEFEDRRPRNFGSAMELKEIGIRFENRRMKSLMDISFKENLLFPQLLLPTMFINDTTISQLLNLTAFEAFSYSGCGVTSYIHFMDSLINDGADVKMLRSEGILHHSLGSDDEAARLFNTWPADVTNQHKLFSNISTQILRQCDRTVKISIAKWWDKYFGSPWTAISFVAAVVLLYFTAVQTYFAAFPRR